MYSIDSNGKDARLPAQSHIDAYEKYSDILKQNSNDSAARLMLGKIDPGFLQFCQAVKARAQKLAEQQLARGMFYGGTGSTTQTASELLNTERWQTHSQMISWQDAKGPPIELKVEHVELQSEAWQKYWKLYCLQRLAITDRENSSNLTTYPRSCQEHGTSDGSGSRASIPHRVAPPALAPYDRGSNSVCEA